MGGIGPEAKAAVPALVETLKDRDTGVRRGAAWALVRIDPQTDRATAALTFPQGIGPVVVAGGSVWVWSNDQLYRIDSAAMKGF